MTTPHTTAPHLDLDALADLLVGEGSEPQVEHVAGCSGCAARLTELDDAQLTVSTALSALPAPAVPPGLADRLLAALEGAQPLPAVEPEGPGGSTALPPPDEREELLAPTVPAVNTVPAAAEAARTVTPLRRAAPSRRPLPTWLPGAAVAVLVLSAGGLAVATLSNGSSDNEVASSGAAGVTSGSPEQGAATAGVVRNESGTDYAATPDAFDRLLPEVLAGTARSADAPPEPAASAAPDAPLPLSADRTASLDRLREPAALDGCLSALVPPDGSVQPLAVDYAAYAGAPALVVVLPSRDPAVLDVYVVGPDCAPGNDSTQFFTRVDRP